MNRFYKIIPLLLILSGCASWTPAEKRWLGASWLATGADIYYTERALDNPGNHELNPFLGDHPSDTKLITYVITSQIGVTILAHFMPEWRKWLLGGKTVLNTGCAIHNSQLD